MKLNGEKLKIERFIDISRMFEELKPEDQKYVAGVIQGLSYRKINSKGA